MALVLIDPHNRHAKKIRDNLKGTAVGLNIESFLDPKQGLLWANENNCEVILVHQAFLEELSCTSDFKQLIKKAPILVLKDDDEPAAIEINGGIIDYIGPIIDKESLLARIDNLKRLQNANQQIIMLNQLVSGDINERYVLALNGSNDGVWDWDIKTNKIFVSSRWMEMIGFHEGDLEAEASTWFSRVHPEDASLIDTAIDAHLKGVTDRLECEYRIRHKNGYYRWVLTRGQAIYDAGENVTRLVGSQTDITMRKQAEEQLAHSALRDPLTGLANRALLMERLSQIIIQHRRDPSQIYAILYLDLDHFKQINDNLGHEAGDEILKAVSTRLLMCSRENDTVARLGGDEFVILISGTDTQDDVIRLADRILESISQPILVHNQEIRVSISIGIVTDTQVYTDPETSIRNADHALYCAKSAGRNRYEFFDPSMRLQKSKHFTIQTTLAGALERNELVMYYQPIIDIKDQSIKGFEALMRWKHQDSGFIYPHDFIAIAEETGLINEMGNWALKTACQQLHEWNNTFKNEKEWYMAVNVSGKQLETDHLQLEVVKVINDTKIRPDQLILEITENVLMRDYDLVAPFLCSLKKYGVRLALDDFGTGYSSLVVLHDYPFDIVKIAREFISDIDQRPKAEKTVRLIEYLAKEIGVQTVAEGVETLDEMHTIQKLGCSVAQGFLFCRPQDAEGISLFLREHYKNKLADIG